MRIHREDFQGVALLTLVGDFDSFVLIKPFMSEVDAVHEDDTHTIILNMGLVRFMTSPAVGALIREARRCREAGGDLILSQPSAGVHMTIESLGLVSRFSIYADDAAALEGLSRDAPVKLEDSTSSVVMVHVPGHRLPLVCRLRRLGSDTMECDAPQRPRELVEGRELKLRFRLPLYRRDLFETKARLEQLVTMQEGVRLTLRFTAITDDEREAIEHFCNDIRDLRAAAHDGELDEPPARGDSAENAVEEPDEEQGRVADAEG